MAAASFSTACMHPWSTEQLYHTVTTACPDMVDISGLSCADSRVLPSTVAVPSGRREKQCLAVEQHPGLSSMGTGITSSRTELGEDSVIEKSSLKSCLQMALLFQTVDLSM